MEEAPEAAAGTLGGLAGDGYQSRLSTENRGIGLIGGREKHAIPCRPLALRILRSSP